MYNVYILKFKKDNLDYVYVGCTNDIKRRKDQHNENARNGKSKLGLFLKKNNIILQVKDFVVLMSLEDRAKALSKERNYAKFLSDTNVELLNDNYSKNCSRKGKEYNNYFKKLNWVLVDFKNHTETIIYSLKKYCYENELSYKELHATHKQKPHQYKNQFCVFKFEEWETFDQTKKEKYLNGEYLKEIYKNNLKEHIKRTSKTYKVLFPDGHYEIITNLDKFARDNNINPGNLHNTIRTNKTASGYKAYKID